MTLKEYIAKLKAIPKKYHDLPVIYSSDDEGNSYHGVVYDPSPGSFDYDNNQANEDTEKANAVCIN